MSLILKPLLLETKAYDVVIIGDSHAERGYESRDQSKIYCRALNSFTAFNLFKHYERDPALFIIPKANKLVYCFGEVDVRCHIGRLGGLANTTHKDGADHWESILGKGQKRKIEDLIWATIDTYVQFVKQHSQDHGGGAKVAIRSLTPPTNYIDVGNPTWGTIQERVIISQRFNQLLERQCHRQGFEFIDITPIFSVMGQMSVHQSDGNVHIGGAYSSFNVTALNC